MSISCNVMFKDEGKKPQSLSIAAEGTFSEYWEKPSISLKLEYIPQFSDGLWIYEEQIIIKIMEELKILKTYWSSITSDNESEKYRIRRILERLNELQEFLEIIQTHWSEVRVVFF